MPQLFPLKVIQLDPRSGSADTRYTGEADDGQRYLIKEQCSPGYYYLPANEWICSSLAQSVNLAVPQFSYLEMPNGDIVFGSRWIADANEARHIFFNNNIHLLTQTISKLFAFDLFIHNDDRHAGNYLAYQLDGAHRLVAMDFSRAWLYNGWPMPAPPPASPCNTLMIIRVLASVYGFDQASALELLNLLRLVPTNHISGILQSMPAIWMPNQQRQALLSWWNSQARFDRIDVIEQGIQNGIYV